VTTRGPGDGYDEVSFGRDPPPRPTSTVLLGVAAACLVVGFLAGGQTDVLPGSDSAVGAASSAMPVAVGAIANVEPSAEHGDEFELPVFNAGADEIEVTIVDLGGWTGLDSATETIAPDTWALVPFSAPPDCSDPLPASVLAVLIQAKTSSGRQYEEDVPVPDDRALVEYHQVVCAPVDPIAPGQLAGVWHLETAYGPQAGLEGFHLMRFNRDGTFVADPEGGLFSGDQALWGSYRLRGSRLTIDVEGGYGCGPGSTSTARAGIRADGTLTLAWLRGACPRARGDVWILRRVLLDVGLPARPAGVGPAGS